MDISIIWWEAALLVQSFFRQQNPFSSALLFGWSNLQHSAYSTSNKKWIFFFFFRNSCWIMCHSRCWEWSSEFDSFAPTLRGFDKNLFWCKMTSLFPRGLYTNTSLSYNRAGEGMLQHYKSSVNRQQLL